jgi:hypothetical protein
MDVSSRLWSFNPVSILGLHHLSPVHQSTVDPYTELMHSSHLSWIMMHEEAIMGQSYPDALL